MAAKGRELKKGPFAQLDRGKEPQSFRAVRACMYASEDVDETVFPKSAYVPNFRGCGMRRWLMGLLLLLEMR